MVELLEGELLQVGLDVGDTVERGVVVVCCPSLEVVVVALDDVVDCTGREVHQGWCLFQSP